MENKNLWMTGKAKKKFNIIWSIIFIGRVAAGMIRLQHGLSTLIGRLTPSMVLKKPVFWMIFSIFCKAGISGLRLKS
jgi:hypothetical protein